MKAIVYEILNPSIPDMFLDDQIDAGCNDWKAECSDGAVFLGETEDDVRGLAMKWMESES